MLVIGGTGALGRVVCRKVAAAGAALAFTYHRFEDRAVALAEELGCKALPLELESVASIEATVADAVRALEGLDALVVSAGVAETTPAPPGDGPRQRHPRASEIDEAAWDRMAAVNVKGAFFAVRAALPALADGGGNVVLVGSVDGHKPVPAPVHYATAKGALEAMARALAKEVGGSGVRVNVVAPGVMDAGLSQTLPADLLAEYRKHAALKRSSTVPEVAGPVTWFALENTYVTGQTILVDGGL